MRWSELFEDDRVMSNEKPALIMETEHDAVHFAALEKTGFFGHAGAGCLIMARDTGRLLIAQRSQFVEQPDTFGTWGGAIDPQEDRVAAVRREVHEETGFNGAITIEPMYVFKSNAFRYYNFLVLVETEFLPRLNWENRGFVWTDFGHWPTPLHFGLVSLLKDPASVNLMQHYAEAAKSHR